jgi:hypothetical protein
MAQGNSLENLNCCINKRTVLTFLEASLTQTSPKLANFGPYQTKIVIPLFVLFRWLGQKTISDNSPPFKTSLLTQTAPC